MTTQTLDANPVIRTTRPLKGSSVRAQSSSVAVKTEKQSSRTASATRVNAQSLAALSKHLFLMVLRHHHGIPILVDAIRLVEKQ